MSLVYLSFGAEDYHLQTAHSLRSLRASGYRGAVQVHSDRPDWFTARPRLMRLGLQLRTVTAGGIAALCGNGYLYKYKLALLRALLLEQPAGVLLSDSDTVYLHNPQPLLDALAAGGPVVVYETEGPVAEGIPELREFYHQHQTELSSFWPAAMPIHNSGLIGVGAADRDWLARALDYCDRLYRPGAAIHTFEQIALSAALFEAGRAVRPAPEFINHYYLFKRRMVRGLRGLDRLGLDLPWPAPEKLSHVQIRDGTAYLQQASPRRAAWLRPALRLGLTGFAQLAERQRRCSSRLVAGQERP